MFIVVFAVAVMLVGAGLGMAADKEVIASPDAPKAIGPYSQAIRYGNMVFLSGQIPIDPKTGELSKGTIEEQTKLVFSKIELLLKESGSSLNKVLQVRIFLTDIDLWDTVNKVYAEIFADHKPARCVIPGGKLHYGSLLEVEAIAFV